MSDWPTLADLPPPPDGRTGWPWTDHPASLAGEEEVSGYRPKISIVIPTLNHGSYIEETIRSVLLQRYSNLELIIMDGGSSDETLSIIEKYGKWIDCWRSEKDNGQVDAIVKGFDRSSGEIINWLNSDDLLLPNALECVAAMRKLVPDAELFVGAREQITREGLSFRVQDSFAAGFVSYALGWPDFPQETTFFTAELYKKVGIDRRFNYVFDTAFHWKALRYTAVLACSSMLMGKFRVYPEMKTLRFDKKKIEEHELLKREYQFAAAPIWLIHFCERMGVKGLLAWAAKLLQRHKRIVGVYFDVRTSEWKAQKYF